MTLEVEGKRIGPGEKCFLMAELSANHDRDLDQALALVDAAAIRGVSDRLSTIPFGQRGRHAFMLHYDAALQHELKG